MRLTVRRIFAPKKRRFFAALFSYPHSTERSMYDNNEKRNKMDGRSPRGADADRPFPDLCTCRDHRGRQRHRDCRPRGTVLFPADYGGHRPRRVGLSVHDQRRIDRPGLLYQSRTQLCLPRPAHHRQVHGERGDGGCICDGLSPAQPRNLFGPLSRRHHAGGLD